MGGKICLTLAWVGIALCVIEVIGFEGGGCENVREIMVWEWCLVWEIIADMQCCQIYAVALPWQNLKVEFEQAAMADIPP